MENQVSYDLPWPDVQVAHKQAVAVEGVPRLLEREREPWSQPGAGKGKQPPCGLAAQPAETRGPVPDRKSVV